MRKAIDKSVRDQSQIGVFNPDTGIIKMTCKVGRMTRLTHQFRADLFPGHPFDQINFLRSQLILGGVDEGDTNLDRIIDSQIRVLKALKVLPAPSLANWD